LQAAFASTATVPGAFAASQDPIVVGQDAYGTGAGNTSAYFVNFPASGQNVGISNIFSTSLSFISPDGTQVANYPMLPKAIHDEMGGTFDEFGRMRAALGLEVLNSNAALSTFAMQSFVDPPTEFLYPGKIQIWKITHNGVDSHPIHFHLFDVQVVNRVAWDGFMRLPDANEMGWKDTVRISPLEDTIVAFRPVTPKVPFAMPENIRPLNPTQPLGSTMGFGQIDPLTGAALEPLRTNVMTNFGFEYTWHCHILSHEENDMMRTTVFLPKKYDINRDDSADMLLFNINTGQAAVWYMNDNAYTSDALLSQPANVASGWKIVGAGDHGSIILQNSSDGQVAFWNMLNTTYQSDAIVAQPVNVAAGWNIVATGDFDSDAKTDLVLQNSNNGQVAIWIMDGSTFMSDAVLSQTVSIAAGWKIVGAGDFNGDTRDDLLLQNSNTGRLAVWFLNGTTYASDALLAKAFNAADGWSAVGTGDFNKDNKADIVLQNSANGNVAVWLMNGTAFVSDSVLSQVSAVAAGWTVVGPR
jgi:hypothetical protein